jgi:hypothetical protein
LKIFLKEVGFEPTKSNSTSLQPVAFVHLAIPPINMDKKYYFFILKLVRKIRKIFLKVCLDKKLKNKKHLNGINYFRKSNRFYLLKEKRKTYILKIPLFFSRKKIVKIMNFLLKNTQYFNQKPSYNLFESETIFMRFYEEKIVSQPFDLKFFFFSRYSVGSSYYLNSFAAFERFQIQLRVYKEIFKNDFKILVSGNEQQKKLLKIISNTLSKSKENKHNIKFEKTKQHYIKRNKKSPNVILFLDSLHQEFLLNQSYYFDDILTLNFYDDLTQTTTFSTIFPISPKKDLETSCNFITLFQEFLKKKKNRKKRIAQR